MKISEILNINSIECNLNCNSKDEAIHKLIDLAYHSGKILNIETATKEVFKREGIMSTGVGKGIALPHAKTDAVSDIIGALAILSNQLDYQSLDGESVNIIFMLLGKENNVGLHLRILSKISRLMNNDGFRSELREASDSKTVIEIFNKYEEEYFG